MGGICYPGEMPSPDDVCEDDVSIRDIMAEARQLHRDLLKEDVAKASEAFLTGGAGKMTRGDYHEAQRKINVGRNKGKAVVASGGVKRYDHLTTKPGFQSTTSGRALVPYKPTSTAVERAPQPTVNTRNIGGGGPTGGPRVTSSRRMGTYARMKSKMRAETANAKYSAKERMAGMKGKMVPVKGATVARTAGQVSAAPAAATVLGAGALATYAYNKHAERKMVSKVLRPL